jgi:hypothetical protein
MKDMGKEFVRQLKEIVESKPGATMDDYCFVINKPGDIDVIWYDGGRDKILLEGDEFDETLD